uniref:Ion transport domain-containing protein n=1 Tax=Haptolina ericina TaxID=156174 RepID=A0A7S3ABW6_9EUKA
MGKLASCTDPSLLTREECDAASMAMSMYGAGGVVSWSNPPVGSFDDFGASMRLLYVISTTDEWEIIMYKLMDSNEPGMAAIRNDYDLASLFAVSWMLLGSFFALNLFVGVVIDQFNRIKVVTVRPRPIVDF